MEKKLATLTFTVYIGVALLIGYKMYTLEDPPSNSEILEALENGAVKAMREHSDTVSEKASEQ